MSVEYLGRRANVEGVDNPTFKNGDVKIEFDNDSSAPLQRGQEHKVYNTLANNETAKGVLSAHNISYQVNVSKGLCKGKEKKQILNNVTAIFRPGMNAIMGSTGCGKSSFLDVLADRKDKSCVSGTILLDGKPVPENFKCMVGYVVQADDVVMGTLTIRENFHFSASLRLPQSLTQEERKRRVENVIKDLSLKKCADTKVGTQFLRGVSGGERRRCNIGMELIIQPEVLFLDEPTTGLDANTANQVLHILWRLSRQGRCIVFSIHQPRYTIYRMFDTILLLSNGQTVYHGPASETLEFFKQQGFECQPYNNPPDFFLDVLNGDPMMSIHEDNAETVLSMELDENESQHDKLIKGFRESTWYTKLEEDAGTIMKHYQSLSAHHQEKVKYATSFLFQLKVLAGRQVRNLVRNPQTSVMTLFSSLFFAMVASIIFWQVGDESSETGLLDRGGALFFLIMNQMFFNFAAVEIFITERAIFRHENISGFYRVSVYFLVKVFTDLLPLRLFPVTIISSICYFTVGFRDGVDHFFKFMLALYCLTNTAAALCFFISSIVRVFAVAQMALSLCFVIMMMFGGFIVSLESIPEWINWLKYISIVKYAYSAVLVNEYKDNFCINNSTQVAITPALPNLAITANDPCLGNAFLRSRGMDYEEEWDYWSNIVGLTCLAFIFFTFSYISLRRMKKHN